MTTRQELLTTPLHPITGERIVFLKRSRDTGGVVLQMQHFMAPGGFVAAPHVHPNQEERFAVRDAPLVFKIRGVERMVSGDERAPTDQTRRMLARHAGCRGHMRQTRRVRDRKRFGSRTTSSPTLNFGVSVRPRLRGRPGDLQGCWMMRPPWPGFGTRQVGIRRPSIRMPLLQRANQDVRQRG
jgi:hypothetical protein